MSAYDNWKLAEPPDYSDPFDDIDADEFYESLPPSSQQDVDEAFEDGGEEARTEKLRELWHKQQDAWDEYERENRLF